MIYFTFFPDYKKKINVNGNAIFSEIILNRYFNFKKDILVNTTSINLFTTRIRKILSYLKVFYLVTFLNQKQIFTVMLDKNGFYFHVLFCYLINFFSSKIIIYHHSFNYINNRKKLLSILSSKKITHVTISKKQQNILKSYYNLNNSILVENYIFFTNKEVKKKKKFNKKIIFFF